ncbi:MAG: hypothetical protein JNL60_04340 [Bacteroidia bacterium]|nr:hypothetical protein [Bacteroidia bacterium]
MQTNTTPALNGTAKTSEQVYYSKHIPEEAEFTTSLMHIPEQDRKHLVSPSYEMRGDDTPFVFPLSDSPAEVYELQSVLFNDSVSIDKGTVRLTSEYYGRWKALEDLFKFLRPFSREQMQRFMETFEQAVSEQIEKVRSNPGYDLYNILFDLHRLQEFSRIVINLGDEPDNIIEDLRRIAIAKQFGVTTEKPKM